MTSKARNRVAVLTGATSGIGEATARRLAAEVDTLIVLGPESAQSVEPLIEEIRSHGVAEVHYIAADFTQLSQVIRAATEISAAVSQINLLINDAAVPGAPERLITVDGFERTLQVNALAPALLTRMLVPRLAPDARVVNVASSAHRVERFDLDDPDLEREYSPVMAYARAKLAMVTWSSLLAEELEAQHISVVSLCPGLNDTPLSAAMMGRIGGPPSQGAERVLFAATAAVPSGSYLEADSVVGTADETHDASNRMRLATLYRERLSRFVTRPEKEGAR